MNDIGMKKGSALLIVLGMVSFMVVSAVGFAVFMRHNRIPSSFLRRNTAAHQLARAALSCAMNDIDAIVNDNPHPGLGNVGARPGFDWQMAGYRQLPQNRWIGRVFTPYTVSEGTTVSTLTLEGLAYLPPVMVNDVRFYSRRTATAQWKRLDYDSGRYAFCAVDVSDYFDICRVVADRPRGSGDQNLVSLAYLFEDGGHRNWGEIAPKAFQDKLNEIISEKPLVSLADYNLALKSHSCDLKSPFVEYIEQNGAKGFYNDLRTTDKTNPEYLRYALQRFVVDGHSELDCEEWCRGAIKNGGNGARLEDKKDYLDITKDDEHQPFPQLIDKDSIKLTEVMEAGGGADFWDWAYKPGSGRPAIRTCESVALCDYLDKDDIPLSVALPTVERVPMLVGIELDAGSGFKVGIQEKETPEPTKEENGATVERKTVTYYPKFEGDIVVNAATTFPFKYRSELNGNRTFNGNVEGHLYLLEKAKVWAEDDPARGCRTPVDGPIGILNGSAAKSSGSVGLSDCVFVCSSSTRSIRIPKKIDEEEDAVSDVDLALKEMRISFDDYSQPEKFGDSFLVQYKLKREITESNPNPEWELDGTPELGYKFIDVSAGTKSRIKDGVEYVWGMSLAVRLREGKELVDMAPAHINDDSDPSNKDADGIDAIYNAGKLPRPVLRFDDRNGGLIVNIELTKEGYDKMHEQSAKGVVEMVFEPKAYLTDDPRYNYASENWYPETPSGGGLGDAWLEKVSCDGKDGRDNDIFMSVSNQGYLQDVGEIAFLPRVAGLTGNQDLQPVKDAFTGKIPKSRGTCANAGIMWKTYSCFSKPGADAADDVYSLRLVSPVRGFRVNPFTNDEMVKLAPFLNTPYDWWAAGTNLSDSVKENMIYREGKTSTLENALKYSFGERGVEAKVEFQYMEKLAEEISAKLRSGGSDWYNTWKKLDWIGGGDTSICGVDLHRTLHDVDRKYLCSYWRKCYANAQQLFIVFFRAEPVVLGGASGDGNTPAQLGARGVAVVWREPTRPNGVNDDVPHRMRVLFYRQFD